MNLASRLWRSSLGKKFLMALSGVILFGFVIGHLIGNLQIFIPDGGAAIDAYGRFLQSSKALLWTTRIGLLVAVIVHIVCAIALTAQNKAARPEPYKFKDYRDAGYAARTMMISGPLIALFVIYHLGHFTTGHFHRDFEHLAVHHNMITGFRVWWASVAYIVAMVLLGMHLFHGGWSMFQSVGVNHPMWTPILKKGAAIFAVLITLGYISIPLAIWAGIVK
jgi:succinate dehydrogenase / fumarate reductase, cytochrome b subunit